jgi:hypothetical protein
MRESRTLRWLALLSAGAFGVHQLRYLAGDPGHGHDALSSHAHAYLPLAGALVLFLFVASVAHFAGSLMLARGGELRPPRPPRFTRAWFGATLTLIAIFATQESLEGALLSGHTSGLHGLFGHGGWTVFLFAPLVGALMALVMRGASSVLLAAARRADRVARRPSRGRWRLLPDSVAPQFNVLACHLAGRAPPA